MTKKVPNYKVGQMFSLVRMSLSTGEMEELMAEIETEIEICKKYGITHVINKEGYPLVDGKVIDEFELADLENKEKKR